ncbi:MAG: hypothetical protein OXK17_08335 [Thaumarchaeota archaeon]|nr:hypothetical protein [Nitrososphaerota archaeon]
MRKKLLACKKCGYVQAVKSDVKWACGRCKKQQLVDAGAVRTETGTGKSLCTCPDCGYTQSVGVDLWMCYNCKRLHPMASTLAPAGAAQ